MNAYKILILSLFLIITAFSCKEETKPTAPPPPAVTVEKVPERSPTDYSLPKWAKGANIYEVDLKQYTTEGTFNAFVQHLPELKEMGIDILTFMPINPISQTKNTGSQGSQYAISDYKAINPDLGTMADFKTMVKAIHDLDMRLIIDWVPNHTGWDHKWITEHKEWYSQDSVGNIIEPSDPTIGNSLGWANVADLNYDNKTMRAEMIEDLSFWVKEIKIDGFRMNLAHNVPDDFWKEVRDALFAHQRPLFLLSGSDVPSHRNSRYFHATTGSSLNQLFYEIAQGKKKPSYIDTLLKKDRKDFRKGFHVYSAPNQKLGKAHQTFSILSTMLDGMPMLSSNQKKPDTKQLASAEKDETIELYTKLNKLKRVNPSLWNGRHGGKSEKMLIDNDDAYCFIRTKVGYKVMGLFNLTNKRTSIKIPIGIKGTNIMNDQTLRWMSGDEIQMEPWQFYLIKNK